VESNVITLASAATLYVMFDKGTDAVIGNDGAVETSTTRDAVTVCSKPSF
jgi:hypothetical protein